MVGAAAGVRARSDPRRRGGADRCDELGWWRRASGSSWSAFERATVSASVAGAGRALSFGAPRGCDANPAAHRGRGSCAAHSALRDADAAAGAAVACDADAVAGRAGAPHTRARRAAARAGASDAAARRPGTRESDATAGSVRASTQRASRGERGAAAAATPILVTAGRPTRAAATGPDERSAATASARGERVAVAVLRAA